jgi:hypothetical protein
MEALRRRKKIRIDSLLTKVLSKLNRIKLIKETIYLYLSPSFQDEAPTKKELMFPSKLNYMMINISISWKR